jgi:hypothetical protein
MTTKAATSRRLTRYLAGPAIALGLALASPAVANAENAWDIGAYDSCVAGIATILTRPQYEAAERDCCIRSRGVWDLGNSKCVAPAPEEAGRNPFPHVMQPSPLPAPPGDIGTAPGQVG